MTNMKPYPRYSAGLFSMTSSGSIWLVLGCTFYTLSVILLKLPPEKPLGFLLLVAIPVVTGAVWVIVLIRGWLKSTMSK
jgi:hypothetical protein